MQVPYIYAINIDYHKNSYGDILLDFLINYNCIVLNGRGKGSNDYTSISSKGVAVVDYATVHQDVLPLCDNLCVIRAAELFDQTGLVGCCDTEHNILDLSFLYWNVALQNPNCIDYSENDNNSYRIKYDVTNIPDDFMCDESCMKNMNEITAKHSNLGVTESHKKFCVIMNEAMLKSLRSRKISLGKILKRQNRYKPWWSDILTELWNNKRASERRYCKSNLAENSDLRKQFI